MACLDPSDRRGNRASVGQIIDMLKDAEIVAVFAEPVGAGRAPLEGTASGPRRGAAKGWCGSRRKERGPQVGGSPTQEMWMSLEYWSARTFLHLDAYGPVTWFDEYHMCWVPWRSAMYPKA